MKTSRHISDFISDDDHIAIFEELKDIISDYNPRWIELECGVTDQTIYNWLSGKTRKPRLDTIAKVARSVGYELFLGKIQTVNRGKRAKLKVVK